MRRGHQSPVVSPAVIALRSAEGREERVLPTLRVGRFATVEQVSKGGENAGSTVVVEFRAYRLKAGRAMEFDRLVREISVPMLQRWNFDIVAMGFSLLDHQTYYLVRAYASVADLERTEAEFYASDEWRNGPRLAILDCIDLYTSVILPADQRVLDGLRQWSAEDQAWQT